MNSIAIQWDGQQETSDLIMKGRDDILGSLKLPPTGQWATGGPLIHQRPVALGEWVVFTDTGVHHCRLRDGVLFGLDGFKDELSAIEKVVGARASTYADLVLFHLDQIATVQKVLREAVIALADKNYGD